MAEGSVSYVTLLLKKKIHEMNSQSRKFIVCMLHLSSWLFGTQAFCWWSVTLLALLIPLRIPKYHVLCVAGNQFTIHARILLVMVLPLSRHYTPHYSNSVADSADSLLMDLWPPTYFQRWFSVSAFWACSIKFTTRTEFLKYYRWNLYQRWT